MKQVRAAMLGVCAWALGCGPATPPIDVEALKDPQKCQSCHPDHYKEWSGSMHAYAAEDPVFIAMNARGQRETKGALGTFCVNCHAPMAVNAGATKDGLNLKDLPAPQKGVTCYFCHSVDSVHGTQNNPLALAADGVFRGEIRDPVHTTMHEATYSKLLDREQPESATLCGSCHDIQSPAGAHIERTFSEWQGTLFSHPPAALACGQCHMDGRDGLAAQAPGVKLRHVKSHMFPGVDVALSTFAETDPQRAAVQAALDTTVQAEICVKGDGSPGSGVIQIVLDNVGAGHLFPSGAAQDRRAWVEVIGYAKTEVIYRSGVVADGDSVLKAPDADLWLIRDCMLDAQDKQVPMFWQAASHDSNQLPAPTTIVQTDPAFFRTHVMQQYPRPTSKPAGLPKFPDRVTLRVRIQPIGLDVLDDLIASGDLDAALRPKMPTFSLKGTELEWTPATASVKYIEKGTPVACTAVGLTSGASTANPAPAHTKCAP